MGAREYSADTTTDTTVTTTTETVVATLPNVSTPGPGWRVTLRGFCQLTTGAATTGLTWRVRRGSAITDTLVDEANAVQVEAAAGSTEDHEIVVVDTPPEVAGQTYVLTVQQAAATGNGTAVQASLTATVH